MRRVKFASTDVKALILAEALMAALCIYRSLSYVITGFFVSDEYGYFYNAAHGAIYGDRWFFGWLNVILFSLTRPYLLPHDQRVPSMVIVSELPCSNTAVGGSCSEEPYEETGITAHEWCDMPRVESPTPYSFSESDGCVGGSVVSLALDEQDGREE